MSVNKFPDNFMPRRVAQHTFGDGKGACQKVLDIVVEQPQVDPHAPLFHIGWPRVNLRISDVGGEIDLRGAKAR